MSDAVAWREVWRNGVKRSGGTVCALVLLLVVWCGFSPATASERSHGLSAFGELRYPLGFKHFKYVNPDAPKGGRLTQIGSAGLTTFDNFNPFLLKGDAAQGLGFLFDSLMVRANDEPDAVYGLIAHAAEIADDGSSVTFYLRKEAKFSDGTPVTADDVVFTFNILRDEGHPQYAIALADVTKAVAVDKHTVRYEFQGALTRDLPLNVATLPVLSRVFYRQVEFSKTTLEPPLGSGPYEIARFEPGTFITYKLREDYWAKDLPVNRGRFNFARIRYEYFRDRTSELQNLLSGSYDLREEFTSKDWATAYDVPAVHQGKILKRTLEDKSPSGAQGFFINTRNSKFQDVRVRKALDLAFDFEWSNRNLFYGLYKRTNSFFENSDMKATGKPSSEELVLLEPFRKQLPEAVFGEPYTSPVTDGSGNIRGNLYKARKLLTEAGWRLARERKKPEANTKCGFFCWLFGEGNAETETHILKNSAGETLDIEFLIYDSSFERVVGPYVRNLRRVGVNAFIRKIDPAQFQRRMKSFDFDITTQRYSLRLTPGVELKSYWSSHSAQTDGSFNLAGISDPVVDALIDKVTAAKSREELRIATRAIDRVLRAGHYWVPHWYKGAHNLAHWDRFSWPDKKPDYDRAVEDTWWYDNEKAAKLAN
jgi:microcin C transport system substrate-binding protein